MKNVLILLFAITLSGCYTQVQLIERRDDSEYVKPRKRSGDFSQPNRYDYDDYAQNNTQFNEQNGLYSDYEQGFTDGYDRGFSAFVDWETANRFNNYYSRFYWTDPYWGASFYDPFLWDPFWGFYGGWGVSYFDWRLGNRWGWHGGWGWNIWGWNNWGWNNNVVVIVDGRDNRNNGSRRWTYQPRDFGNNTTGSVRSSQSNQPRGSSFSPNGRNSSSGKYSVPTRPGRSGGSYSPSPRSSGGSSSGKSSSGSSGKSGSSGSSGGSRPSRTGGTSAYQPTTDFTNDKAITIPTGYGTGLSSRSSGNSSSYGNSSSVSTPGTSSRSSSSTTSSAFSSSSSATKSSVSSSSSPRSSSSSTATKSTTSGSSSKSSSRSSRSGN